MYLVLFFEEKEFKKEIELKIKIVKNVLKTYCGKGDKQYEWHSGYLKACKEILEEFKELKKYFDNKFKEKTRKVTRAELIDIEVFKETWDEINKEEETKKDE